MKFTASGSHNVVVAELAAPSPGLISWAGKQNIELGIKQKSVLMFMVTRAHQEASLICSLMSFLLTLHGAAARQAVVCRTRIFICSRRIAVRFQALQRSQTRRSAFLQAANPTKALREGFFQTKTRLGSMSR